MIRRLPLWPTLLVLAAVATMLGLGVWQLRRAAWKGDLLARYEMARFAPPIAMPRIPDPRLAFRRATAFCVELTAIRHTAGRNLRGQAGWSHVADCRAGGGEGPGFSVDVGWAREARTDLAWPGGEVTGVLLPTAGGGHKLVATQAAPGLEPSQPPGPETVPNNHRLYAAQWFFFAAAALVIYVLAVRRRMSAR